MKTLYTNSYLIITYWWGDHNCFVISTPILLHKLHKFIGEDSIFQIFLNATIDTISFVMDGVARVIKNINKKCPTTSALIICAMVLEINKIAWEINLLFWDVRWCDGSSPVPFTFWSFRRFLLAVLALFKNSFLVTLSPNKAAQIDESISKQLVLEQKKLS